MVSILIWNIFIVHRTTIIFIYISDLNCAIRYCSVHHFADDTNLLNNKNSVKRINEEANQDLKNLKNWLNGNKICLNISKTEVALFKSSIKLTDEKDFTPLTQ